MSEKRIEKIIEKIAFIDSNRTKFKNPELLLVWLNTLLLTLD